MKTTILKTLGAVLLACAATGLSQAAPITGQLDVAGGATLDTNLLSTATRVTAFTGVTVTAAGVTPGSVLDSTIDPGMPVTMTASPWIFGAGQANLWTVGGFTFNLLTSSTNPGSSNLFLAITGTGTIVGN